jgi:hypothetical protein
MTSLTGWSSRSWPGEPDGDGVGGRAGDVADDGRPVPIVFGVVSGVDGRLGVWGGGSEAHLGVDAAAADLTATAGDSMAVPGTVGSAGRSDVQLVTDPDDPHGGERAQPAVAAPRCQPQLLGGCDGGELVAGPADPRFIVS